MKEELCLQRTEVMLNSHTQILSVHSTDLCDPPVTGAVGSAVLLPELGPSSSHLNCGLNIQLARIIWSIYYIYLLSWMVNTLHMALCGEHSFMGQCNGVVIFYCKVDLWGKSTLYKVSDVGLGVVLLVDIRSFDQKRENT